MMRVAVTLVLSMVLAAWIAPAVMAQGIAFAGKDVILLAHTIAVQAESRYELPTAFRLPYGNQGTATITAPTAFEVLAKAVATWYPGAPFPNQVPGITMALKAPPIEPRYEPPQGQQRTKPVLTKDIASNAKPFSTLNPMPTSVNFGRSYTLTMAQYTVAMAMFIEQWALQREMPDSMAIPEIASPKNWDDASRPISLIPEAPVQNPVTMKITINGIELPRSDATGNAPPIPDALTQPFCGQVRIAVTGGGPLESITVTLNGQTLISFDKPGTYGYTLDTLKLEDDTHWLAVTVTDKNGKSSYAILSLCVFNGREGTFSRAEDTEEQPVDVQPAKDQPQDKP